MSPNKNILSSPNDSFLLQNLNKVPTTDENVLPKIGNIKDITKKGEQESIEPLELHNLEDSTDPLGCARELICELMSQTFEFLDSEQQEVIAFIR